MCEDMDQPILNFKILNSQKVLSIKIINTKRDFTKFKDTSLVLRKFICICIAESNLKLENEYKSYKLKM